MKIMAEQHELARTKEDTSVNNEAKINKACFIKMNRQQWDLNDSEVLDNKLIYF